MVPIVGEIIGWEALLVIGLIFQHLDANSSGGR